MKKIKFIIIILTTIIQLQAQNTSDSIVVLSDLKYHSDFEKNALQNFVKYQKDTFNLMMAIDEKITENQSKVQYKKFSEIFDELSKKKIESKSINTKIRMSYQAIHDRFLSKYSDLEFFSTTMETGVYNCVSATILYAMIFDQLKIPYKVMASTNHVYLVANPGPKSSVIETTNPGFENTLLSGDFKQQYVDNLRNSKLISTNDYKNKSVEEIFQEKFKEVKDATLFNLPGFQYYNKAINLLKNNDIENAYKLAQKAYFFFPDNQCKVLLNNALVYQLDKCNYSKVSDIDYLVQYSRFENTDINVVVGIFNNILSRQLQYNNKEAFCDSIYQRLISQIRKKEIIDEISFTYNLQMAFRFQFSEKAIYYAGNALKIKPNYIDANVIFNNYLNNKLNNIENPTLLLDTINNLRTKYDFEQSTKVLNDYELVSYLRMAKNAFVKNNLSLGEKYIFLFEDKCKLPITNEFVKDETERTFYAYSSYYYRKKNTVMQKKILAKGLKFLL